MAHANWRLDNPPVVDVAVSRRMGLFVVARLAARHGIRVRLRPAPAGGLTALVWLPDEVVSHDADTGTPGLRRFEPQAAVAELAAVPGTVEDLVSTTEQEINAARAPKFASLQAESEGNGKLGPRRVPGAGPRPGATPWAGAATTGPLPAFPSSPQPADAEESPVEQSVLAESDAQAAAAYQQSDFGTRPLPAVDVSQPVAQFSAGPEAVAADAGVAATAGAAVSDYASGGYEAVAADRVFVPPSDHVATHNRLPIFEAVESDWFRRGRSGLGGWPGPQESAAVSAATSTTEVRDMPDVAWSTPSDRGWEAAEAASAPSTGGTTQAGLPKRVPQANLVPGAASPESVAPPTTRSAAATRERFASFQRGSREGRAAAGGDDNGVDQEDSSR
jgi:hypothetical protein